MFGLTTRRARLSTVGDRATRALLHVLGPATVDGALQGHSPEARAHWKHRVEENKRVRQEARARRELDER